MGQTNPHPVPSTAPPAAAVIDPPAGPVAPADKPIPQALAASLEYEVIREISRGGMGVVYLARNRRMDRLECLKVVNEALLRRGDALERFEREMRSAARLNHQSIVTAYSSPALEGLVAFAMEFVDGTDLHKLVKSCGPLPVSNACYYAWQVAQGLQHAHERQMVHRDIKPGNLMLTRDGKKQAVKILDFGLAKATSEYPVDGGLTGEGQMLGTPLYMAPEQIKSASTSDIRADIYSLGCTLYYLLTGHAPFGGKRSLYEILHAQQSETARPLNEFRTDVPAELAAIVARMIAKAPADRFQEPADVARALAPYFKQGVKALSTPLSLGGPVLSPTAATDETASPKETNVGLVAVPGRSPLVPTRTTPHAGKLQTMLEVVGSTITWSIAARQGAIRKDDTHQKNAALIGLIAVTVGALILGIIVLWAGGVFSKSRTNDESAVASVGGDRKKAARGGALKRRDAPDGGELSLEPAQRKPSAARVDTGDNVSVADTSRGSDHGGTQTAAMPDEDSRPGDPANVEAMITNSVGMKLVLVPAGEFLMGYKRSPEELARVYPYATKDWFTAARKQHPVRITKMFYLGMHEVTVGEFRQFVDDRGYETDAEKDREGTWGYDAAAKKFVGPRTNFAWHHTGFPQTEDHPAVYISWNDAQAFCRWLSEKEEVEYRLPTEAEWEYACRSGTETLYQNGDDPLRLTEIGNAWDVGVQKRFLNAPEPLLPNDGHVFTAPVGQFQPNAFGLFDMHGNVWEWCADVFDNDYYRVSPTDNPTGPARGPSRILRGGAWDRFAAYCGSSFRFNRPRGNPGYSTGFRIARSLEE